MSVSVFSTDHLLADKAVASERDDSFKRYPFARQLAATVCERRSAESLVIGLHGQWGAGKSSVLNFVQAELANTDVLTVYFNPWRFDSEEQLLQGFFAELGIALQAVATKEAKDAATKAVAFHAQQVVSKLQLLDRDARGESLQNFKSQAKLEQLKKEINELLRTAGKRVLVLIDDIDRLSAPEMHAVLRLVKLTGDFQYTTYLLAFDEDVVARAIGERYAGGSKRDGRRYLEKIIQVPLQLPLIQKEAMQKYFQEGFSRSLALTNTKLPDGEYQRLVSILAESILPRVTTPRYVTRYSNTLLVILPLLRGEANVVDLMLLEALKQFYPQLYKVIAHQQHLLTGAEAEGKSSEYAIRFSSVFDTVSDEFNQVRTLLFSLFPRLHYAYGGEMPYGRLKSTEDDLYNKQAVASAYYFRRYFSYAVQDGEIPETDFNSFLAAMHAHDSAEGHRLANLMIARANEREFTRRLENTIGQVLPEQVPAYLELLRLLEDRFTAAVTSERTMQSFTPLSTLYLSYAVRLPKQEVAETLSLIMLRAKFSVALEFFSDITEHGHWSSDHDLANILTANNYENFCYIIVTRGLVETGKMPWFETFGLLSALFLRAWTQVQAEEDPTESLRRIFDVNPVSITMFLRNIAPLSTASYFDYENSNITWATYEALKDRLDIHYLYEVALSVIKDEKPMPYKGDDYSYTPTLTERVHQFVFQYQQDNDNKATLAV